MELSLPNLHPAIVHLPIVLIPLAALLEASSLATRGRWGSERGAALGWLIAALAATAAFFAGRYAADGLVDIPARVQPLLGNHAEWAERTLVLAWGIAILRAGVTLKGGGASWAGSARTAALLAGVAAVGLVSWTADRGGLLVYGHGLAVSAPAATQAPPAAAPAASSAPGDRLSVGEDGTIAWAPMSGDLGSDDSPVTLRGEGISEGGGEALVVKGRGLVLLPQTLGDVQVNAWVDLSGFEGRVGVLHHVGDGEARGAFLVSTDGAAKLVKQGAEETVMDEASFDPAGLVEISVSAAGKHYKGMINGAVVTHGHGESMASGRVGLLLDGEGLLLLKRLEAVPLKEDAHSHHHGDADDGTDEGGEDDDGHEAHSHHHGDADDGTDEGGEDDDGHEGHEH